MEPVRTPVYILGVNPGPHDGSAALLRDGELVAMAEQERFSRRRHAIGESPARAVRACLDHEGIGLDSVARIAVGWDVPLLAEVEDGHFDEQQLLSWLLEDLLSSQHPQAEVRYVDHHLAHAASAFYSSGLSEAAIVVADGRGEKVSTTMAIGTRSAIEVIRTWGTESSLGHFYGWAADWAGLGMWGTGKLMGLAAYGQACQPMPVADRADGYTISGCDVEGAPIRYHFALMRSRLRAEFRRSNFPFSAGNPLDVMAHANFAASAQGALEDAILGLARYAREVTGLNCLVFAGGVALNCSANGRLIRSGVFDEVWVPPFPDDAGVSLGAALVADREMCGRSGPGPRLAHAFWMPGSTAPGQQSLEALADVSVEQYTEDELPEAVANDLVSGRVVGWWQGRAEVGPRALGARSILCDPRRREAHSLLNAIKGREAWRPLAPAVLSDSAGLVFDGDLPSIADFMLATWPVRKSAVHSLPAAVHVDGSTRPQMVRAAHGRYRAVIEAFQERTGVPGVINTSFNFEGEPIVLSADDALQAFMRSPMDVLVMDDIVIRRSSARSRPPSREQLHSFSFIPWATKQPSFAGIMGERHDND